jgi:hypothetical protein
MEIMKENKTGRTSMHSKIVGKALIFFAIVTVLGSGAALHAKEPASPLLDRYAFTLGSYFMNVDTEVRAGDSQGSLGTRVDFENDLDFPKTDELFRIEGQFLFKGRHQLNLGYYDLKRSAAGIITREIEWRDRVFPVNAEVSGSFDTTVTEISYTYWLVAKEKMAFGLHGGLQNLTMDIGANLGLQRLSNDVGGDLTIDEFVPLIGAEVRRAVTEKLMFRGLGRFVTFSDLGDISQIDVLDLAVGFEHKTFKKGGFGLAYKLLSFDLEVEKRLVRGDIGYSIDGVELYLRFGL